MANKSFVMYDSWMDMVEDMTEEEAGQLLKAIYAYRKDRDYKPSDRAIRPAFNILKQRFEEDDQAYQEKIEKRAEAGKKGGRPKAKETKRKQTKAKKANAFFEKQKNPESEFESESVTESVNEFEKHIYSDDPKVDAAIGDFLKYRKELKKPMGDVAISRFLKRLAGISLDPDTQVNLINEAIERGWQTVYPPKETARSGTKVRAPSFQDQRAYDYDALEAKLLGRTYES